MDNVLPFMDKKSLGIVNYWHHAFWKAANGKNRSQNLKFGFTAIFSSMISHWKLGNSKTQN